MTKRLFILLVVLLLPLTSCAEQTDITFIVAGKTINHSQNGSGNIRTLNYHFFAEIFRQPEGNVTQSGLVTPLSGGKLVPFEDVGYALEMHGGRYKTESELEATYPDGAYEFRFTSPSTGRVKQIVKFNSREHKGSRLPAAPTIKLSQNGQSVAPSSIDPNHDLLVSWSTFSDGGADPLHIMDDLLFVIMGDCDGVRRAHSGRPFENTPYLTFDDSSFVIEAEKLLAENVYQLSVEHAVLDTSKEQGVTAFATFASTTFLEMHTTGKAAPGKACVQVRKAFDAGQQEL
jgi:hypothetical protein